MSHSVEDIRRPSVLLQLLESRALPELGAYAWLYPMLRLAPRGDGHPVLVLPGFLSTGAATFPLRHFLNTLGYKGHRWKLGRNLGPMGYKEFEILGRLKELRHRYGRKVTVIGWSLGGLYARELAWMAPEDVRMVITLGTPFRHHKSTAVTWLYEDLTGQEEAHMPAEFRERLELPPPVPSTAIYSRTDVVVPWRCSLERPAEFAENIRVEGSHCGLGHNPMVLWAIADRLAQPEGEWQPFRRKGLRKILFRAPDQLDDSRQKSLHP
jgi:pimeloyl-ACP methyl ester carboxylesterase